MPQHARRLVSVAFFCSVILPPPAIAQTVEVDEILIREVDRLSWPSLQIDAVDAAIARGAWTPPEAGALDRDGVFWRLVRADEDGWIRDDGLQHGYAFANVTVDEDGPWILEAMGYAGVYVNGEPRVGNVYGSKDEWAAWEPRFDYSLTPILLHRGANHLLFFGNRHGLLRATLHRPAAPLLLNAKDTTLGDLVVGEVTDAWGAIVVLNASDEFVTDAHLQVALDGASEQQVDVPPLVPHGIRKVGFPVRAPAFTQPGKKTLRVRLTREGRALEEALLSLDVRSPAENRRVTFVSGIDNSVQYYGYLPASGLPGPKALVLSLHGASVEAIHQSGSYAPLSWGHVLAPTNRRPYGFNWEGLGRLDALEVLDLGLRGLEIDEDRVYLTGHSMGGHGSWHLATLHPDRFAAVGPSAGWISLWSYRLDPPGSPATPLADMVDQALLQSRTLLMAPNLSELGVYVLHGANDDNVPPEQAHLILGRLQTFHQDLVYHEQPGEGHWWDLSDEPGADCVTWPPMFDFFARHRRPAIDEVRAIRFQTPSPGVSAWNRWVGILDQRRPFQMSTVDVRIDPQRRRVHGVTDNVVVLGLDLRHVPMDSIWIELDGEALAAAMPSDGRVWLARGERWQVTPALDPARKGPHRYGPFREVLFQRTQFVVGTAGTPEENAWALAKARHDAEFLWYQGNASVDVLLDTMFDPTAEPDRNVLLYGNADTHAHWRALWPQSVLTVRRGGVSLGDQELEGDGLGVLAIQPRPGSARALVGIVAASGLAGGRLLHRRPYLLAEVAYPDLTVFEDLGEGTVVRVAGFFGSDWSIEQGTFVTAEAP